ncbi:hypothetical protein H5410_050028 [Solanum commersonii]|uniref:Uncharacterized protein n=1 Tax=Solanum commersonii TaxID=4109 RepID=A0A9J5WUB5_SOLCO|nr:hypothetical protein H5410_050028 [Solanum commersonii]
MLRLNNIGPVICGLEQVNALALKGRNVTWIIEATSAAVFGMLLQLFLDAMIFATLFISLLKEKWFSKTF